MDFAVANFLHWLPVYLRADEMKTRTKTDGEQAKKDGRVLLSSSYVYAM